MYTKKLIALMFNLTLFFLGLIGCILELGHGFTKVIVYYTFDSNVLGVIASGIVSAYLIISIAKDTETIPKWVIMLKYTATSVLTVTFLVVVFVLAPLYIEHFNGLGNSLTSLLFNGNMLYQHFLCPVIAILSTLFGDFPLSIDDRLFGKKPSTVRAAFTALIPTVIYATVTIILNIVGVIEGPYPFLKVRSQPAWASVLWCGLIIGLAYGIAFALAKFGKLLKNHSSKA